MNARNLPPSEQLRPAEKFRHIARVLGDAMLRALPCVAYLPPAETTYHRLREEIEMLENIANDPREHV